MHPIDMETVEKDNCWWNLPFSRERRDITRREERMQKKVKGLYIDKMLLHKVKRRKNNLVMGWIDYRKAYDMVPLLGDRELKGYLR